jgi:hypothetical protein
MVSSSKRATVILPRLLDGVNAKTWREYLMKATLYAALGAVLLVAALPVEANAVVCAKGVYRAGCAGPRGAVVTARPVAARCVYRAGVRVCR